MGGKSTPSHYFTLAHSLSSIEKEVQKLTTIDISDWTLVTQHQTQPPPRSLGNHNMPCVKIGRIILHLTALTSSLGNHNMSALCQNREGQLVLDTMEKTVIRSLAKIWTLLEFPRKTTFGPYRIKKPQKCDWQKLVKMDFLFIMDTG